MSDPKLPDDVERMFEHARAQAPVDRAAIARAWARVEADRGRRRKWLGWIAPVAAASVALAIYALRPQTPAPAPLERAVVPSKSAAAPEPLTAEPELPGRSTAFSTPQDSFRIDPAGGAPSAERRARAGSDGAREPVARRGAAEEPFAQDGSEADMAPHAANGANAAPEDLQPRDQPMGSSEPASGRVELGAAENAHGGATSKLRAPREAYQPRAIREFQDVDWPRLASEELPRAVREIVERRDPKALLAALDALPLTSSDLILVRGGLRAAARRCDDALLDFDQVLADPRADALGPRAARGRALCLGAP